MVPEQRETKTETSKVVTLSGLTSPAEGDEDTAGRDIGQRIARSWPKLCDEG